VALAQDRHMRALRLVALAAEKTTAQATIDSGIGQQP
jgi:hypothetical protein